MPGGRSENGATEQAGVGKPVTERSLASGGLLDASDCVALSLQAVAVQKGAIFQAGGGRKWQNWSGILVMLEG